MLPPLPTWDGLHPLVVHFPIGLLLTVPVFLVAALFAPRHRAWSLAALTVMALGTAGAFLATATGEASADTIHVLGKADEVMEHHEELAELSRNLFAGLTILFGALVAAPVFLRAKWRRPYAIATECVFLVAYLGSCVVLANAAHEGGRLVHEFGIHASLAASAGASIGEPKSELERGTED